MKRFGLAVGVGCLLAACVPAVAGANGDYANNRDWVLGAINRTSLDGTVNQYHAIGAWETRSGGAEGLYSAWYRDSAGNKTGYSGRVTCINVVGQSAIVGITVLPGETRDDLVAGAGQLIRVTNYGGPQGDGNGQLDSISPGAISASGPTVCPAPVKVATPTLRGNVLIHDGDL
jgi:hypothetical protein